MTNRSKIYKSLFHVKNDRFILPPYRSTEHCPNASMASPPLLGSPAQRSKIDSDSLCLRFPNVHFSSSVRNLGFIFDLVLFLSDHVSSVSRSCFYYLRQLGLIRQLPPLRAFTILVYALIRVEHAGRKRTSTIEPTQDWICESIVMHFDISQAGFLPRWGLVKLRDKPIPHLIHCHSAILSGVTFVGNTVVDTYTIIASITSCAGPFDVRIFEVLVLRPQLQIPKNRQHFLHLLLKTRMILICG